MAFFGNKDEMPLDLTQSMFGFFDSFISRNSNKIVTHFKNGETCFAFNEKLLNKAIELVSSEINKEVKRYIDTKYPQHQSREITNEEIMNKLNSFYDNFIKGTTRKDNSDNKNYFLLPEMYKTLNGSIQSIESSLSRLKNLIENQDEIIRSQESTINNNSTVIQSQHNCITRFENDLLFKTKEELLMELILIVDNIQDTINFQQQDKNFENALQSLYDIKDWVEGSLQSQLVRKYELTKLDISSYDPKKQTIIDIEETTDKSLDGTYKTVHSGYYWTIPLVGSKEMLLNDGNAKKFEFVLRPEEVVKLKYVESTQHKMHIDPDIERSFNEVESTDEFSYDKKLVEQLTPAESLLGGKQDNPIVFETPKYDSGQSYIPFDDQKTSQQNSNKSKRTTRK